MGLPYGVDDGLSQVMPMRDVGERIAFGGHARGAPLFLLFFAGWILANLPAKSNLAGSRKGKRPQETPEAASPLAVTLSGV